LAEALVIRFPRREPVKPKTVEDDPNFYGGDKTWHDSGTIDVQLNENGDVIAVWFRCYLLPFRVSTYKHNPNQPPTPGHGSIKGIVFEGDE
jgi:hypothetical protein